MIENPDEPMPYEPLPGSAGSSSGSASALSALITKIAARRLFGVTGVTMLANIVVDVFAVTAASLLGANEQEKAEIRALTRTVTTDILKAVSEPLQPIFKGIWKAFKETCSKIETFVTANMEKVKDLCFKLIETTKTLAKKAAEKIRNAANVAGRPVIEVAELTLNAEQSQGHVAALLKGQGRKGPEATH